MILSIFVIFAALSSVQTLVTFDDLIQLLGCVKINANIIKDF